MAGGQRRPRPRVADANAGYEFLNEHVARDCHPLLNLLAQLFVGIGVRDRTEHSISASPSYRVAVFNDRWKVGRGEVGEIGGAVDQAGLRHRDTEIACDLNGAQLVGGTFERFEGRQSQARQGLDLSTMASKRERRPFSYRNDKLDAISANKIENRLEKRKLIFGGNRVGKTG